MLPETFDKQSIVTLIVFGSMRVGEVLAIRWKRTSADRIQIIERVYDGEFDDVKTEAGEALRSIMFPGRSICELIS